MKRRRTVRKRFELLPSVSTFEVGDGGTLTVADFPELKTRRDYYYIPDRFASAADLADAMDECQPLEWELVKAYEDFLYDLEAQLEEARHLVPVNQKKIAKLEARLESLPEDLEEGTRDWLSTMPASLFKANIVKRIKNWFDDEPNWAFEEEHIDQNQTAQGAALSFFQDMDSQSLRLLGVKIIEGEHPGSTYFAAELRCSIEAANRAAAKAGLPVRFVPPRRRATKRRR